MEGELTTCITDKKAKHIAFWARKNVTEPLVGFIVGSGIDPWSYWLSNPGAAALLRKKIIRPEDLDPKAFVAGQLKYLERTADIDDDIFRTGIPFASIPWMEAIIGCTVITTDKQFASQSCLRSIEEYVPISFESDNPWASKYVEFLTVYRDAFGEDFPVGQSVLRGVSDLFAALLGAQGAIEALIAEPKLSKQILIDLDKTLSDFLKFQQGWIPEFQGGYVVGQYELWAPGPVLRMQEDNLALYSPNLYREFIKPLNDAMGHMTPYTLLHLHSTSLFLLDDLLDLSGIRVFQVSKDEGSTILADILGSLKRIQDSGRCLVLKGRFTPEDIRLMKENLTPCGLSIQPVVRSVDEAKQMLPVFRNWSN